MIKIIAKLFSKFVGRPMVGIEYSNYSYFVILTGYAIKLFRFNIHRLFFARSALLGFMGSGSVIQFGNQFYIGRCPNIGSQVTIKCLSRRGVKIGDNFTIRDSSKIDCIGVLAEPSEGIVIGDNVGVSEHCFIQVRGFLEVGDNVIVGPNTTIITENHNFRNPVAPVRLQGTNRKGTIIHNNVWIGASCIILDGVTIGENAIIGAGSVVLSEVLPNSIVAGNPAKLIRTRSEK